MVPLLYCRLTAKLEPAPPVPASQNCRHSEAVVSSVGEISHVLVERLPACTDTKEASKLQNRWQMWMSLLHTDQCRKALYMDWNALIVVALKVSVSAGVETECLHRQ